MSNVRDFFGGSEYSFSGYLPGMILMIPFLPNDIDTELNGFHYCDGSAFSKTTYNSLWQVIGSRYGSGTTWFRVPDYRGLFIRGVDDGSGYDPDIPMRTLNPNVSVGSVGSEQAQQVLSHTHGHLMDTSSGPAEFNTGDDNRQSTNAQPIEYVGGVETRPKNMAMVFVIKY